MIPIKGIQKTTLVDYPGNIACTIFLGGCNMRCGYCHNKDLALNILPTIPEEEILEFLRRRKKYLQGVCITGGEPTLYPKLKELCKKIKEFGYLVKLDTNGTNPLLLKELIEQKLVDYIAMDIKSSLEKYDKVSGTKVDKEKIIQSVNLIITSGIDYEFRTTVIPDIIDRNDIKEIRNIIKGAKKYCIQQFQAADSTIDPVYNDMKSLPISSLEEFQEIMKKEVTKVEIRDS